MALAGLFGARRQASATHANDINVIGGGGSWIAFACASIAAYTLVISAGAQNVAHGYSLGLASSEFRALVLAAASAGASLLGPFCWLAVFRGRGFGTRCAALLLAVGCLGYAAVCSLGFVAGSRDTATAAISERQGAYQDARAVKDAARTELQTLAALKTPTRAVLDRRRELAKILATSGASPSGALLFDRTARPPPSASTSAPPAGRCLTLPWEHGSTSEWCCSSKWPLL